MCLAGKLADPVTAELDLGLQTLYVAVRGCLPNGSFKAGAARLYGITLPPVKARSYLLLTLGIDHQLVQQDARKQSAFTWLL